MYSFINVLFDFFELNQSNKKYENCRNNYHTLNPPQISMAVCSILYQLATRPAEQQKLYEELRRVIPDPNVPLTVQLLDQCHYLKAFIREVFR